MKINSISGVSYLVSELDATAAFYEALGFRIGKREPGRLTCYVNWFSATFVISDAVDDAFKKDAARSNKGSGVLLHLKVDDIDECYWEVFAHGMTPASEPRKTTSGREFVLEDPDGYKLVSSRGNDARTATHVRDPDASNARGRNELAAPASRPE